MTHINRLPNEILAMILVLAVTQGRPQANCASTTRGKMAPWLSVTHICSRWRDIALNRATLWSDLSFSNPAFTQAMLVRSLETPLSISIKFKAPPHRFLDVLKKALSHNHRLHSVDIQLSVHLTLQAVWEKCRSEAPNLKILSLSSLGDPKFMHHLPEGLLEGKCPSLEHLSLDGFRLLDWQTIPLAPALTHLCVKVNSDMYRHSWRPSPQPFLSCLVGMPLLRHLEVSGILPSLPYPSPVPPHTLNHLEVLRLSDSKTWIIKLLKVIRLPRLKSFWIRFNESSMDIDLFLTSLKTSWDLAQNGIQNLRLSTSIEHTRNRQSSHSNTLAVSFSRPDSTDPVTTDMVLIFSGGRNTSVEQLLRSFGLPPGLTPLHTLKLESHSPVSDSAWTEILSTLPYLRHITLGRALSQGFVDALKSPPNGTSAPFPALEELVFDRVDFDDGQVGASAGRIKRLIDALSSRREQIKALTVNRCLNFAKGDFDPVKTQLPGLKVSWDV
ncbi:hypothetical protein D9611_001272 [Ephemerocybe angulata]|uniref:F-box domain-containing protein n=1 Tax=Ephemerocybe angulata TaxID=980116 RepID=A0A8H5FLT1_9AGAR|nr:hypothetical protein D9611_001272 [Tulosesus angulatus]